MALYKESNYLQHSTHQNFDALHPPGASVVDPGIYRCQNCGDEIAIAKGHTLPPQNHHQHVPNAGPIRWRLIVASMSVS